MALHNLPGGMTRERFEFLQNNLEARLTPEELAAGYIFCCTWDFLLIHKDDPEAQACTCLKAQDGTA